MDVIRQSINKRKAAESSNKKGKKSKAKDLVQDEMNEQEGAGEEEDYDEYQQENTESLDT